MTYHTGIRRWIVAGTAVALVLATAGGASAAQWSRSSLLPLFDLIGGTATLCVTPAASAALADAAIELTAGKPALLEKPCVSSRVTDGEISLDLLGGDFAFEGALIFTREDGATVAFTDLVIKFGIVGELRGVIQGHTEEPITLMTFIISPFNIRTDLFSHLEASDTPFIMTDAAADALAETFGASPWEGGSRVIIGEGGGAIRPIGLLGGLLPLL